MFVFSIQVTDDPSVVETNSSVCMFDGCTLEGKFAVSTFIEDSEIVNHGGNTCSVHAVVYALGLTNIAVDEPLNGSD